MCGIFGIKFVATNKSVNLELVVAATDLMAHRGPDDAGYWVQGSLGLGHRRLSIIDLSPLGHQPMFNEDGAVALVYNGEIYNYQELFQPLRDQGHCFKSKSDTEVIIHAYEEFGFDCLQKFNGMFAFGLWDEGRQLLWVARDRLGIKPLYYYWDGSVFIFASEIKPILQTGFVKPELNENVLDSYFSLGYVPSPETMFKNIYKVRPGHYLCLRGAELSETKYWDFADVPQRKAPVSELRDQLLALLQDSIRIRLRSDVPLGVFLSGGLDSSAVVSLMHEMVTAPINTFTVGYPGAEDFTEEPFAELVAKSFGTSHHVFNLAPDDFFGSLEQLVGFAEEPIVEPAAIALFHISKLARQQATVLLSGEGSDEIFAGYYLYHFMDRIQSIQSFLPLALLKLGRTAAGVTGKLKHAKYADWLSLPLQERYQGTSSYLTDSIKRRLYRPEFHAGKGDYLERTFAGYFDNVKGKSDPLSKMLYVDTKTWLVDDLLVKADKMTMGASIELRVPFLDYRLVEFAASLPSGVKLDSGNGKAILKSIMKGRVPDEIISRKKMGFPVPVGNWFGADLFEKVKSYLSSSFVLDYIDKASMESLLNDHFNKVEDNSKLIMSLLVIGKWHDMYLK